MYAAIVPQFAKILNNLNSILDKAVAHAAAKKYDVNNVLNARLAPDQFNFFRQVQIACDVAKNVAARLAGQEPPKHADTEQTVEQLKERIAKTVQFLSTVKPEQWAGYEKRLVPIGYMPGKAVVAEEFAIQMAIPNFYFHVTTAYSILRHNGIDLGKGDYLGHIEFKDL